MRHKSFKANARPVARSLDALGEWWSLLIVRDALGGIRRFSAKDLLAHLAYWERAAAEEIREFEAGRWPAKKSTRGQMERINRKLVSANRATPRHLLREELILARTESAAAMGRAPEELEERSPLAHIVYSHCVRHRGHHLEQLRASVLRLGKTL